MTKTLLMLAFIAPPLSLLPTISKKRVAIPAANGNNDRSGLRFSEEALLKQSIKRSDVRLQKELLKTLLVAVLENLQKKRSQEFISQRFKKLTSSDGVRNGHGEACFQVKGDKRSLAVTEIDGAYTEIDGDGQRVRRSPFLEKGADPGTFLAVTEMDGDGLGVSKIDTEMDGDGLGDSKIDSDVQGHQRTHHQIPSRMVLSGRAGDDGHEGLATDSTSLSSLRRLKVLDVHEYVHSSIRASYLRSWLEVRGIDE